jgi:outer membrane protein OmpA-like peptidoglycan-associated protein
VRRALIVALVAIAAAACAPRRPATPAPPADSTLLVLLPDPEGGALGRATVTSGSATVSLASDREATEAVARRPPTAPAAIDEARIQQLFGDTLTSLPPPPRAFNLYFQFDSDQLTDAARALLPEILRLVMERPVPDVVAIGHTDTTGGSASNVQLGLRRARTVRDLLVGAGLDATLITVTSVGEADPLVQTADETMEPRNRRVEVSVR